MGIWNKLKEKFSSSNVEEDSNDAQFSDEAPQSKEERVVNDERLQWVLDNFSNWPSPRFEYVALIEKPDAVVGIKRSLKFFKREPNEGVEVYTREFIDSHLDSGE